MCMDIMDWAASATFLEGCVRENSELRLTTSTQKGNEMELYVIDGTDVMDVTEAIRSPTWTQFL